MKSRFRKVALCLTLALAISDARLYGQEANAVADTDAKTAVNAAVSQAAIAAKLAMIGEKKKSPMLLLAAAELLGELTDSTRSSEGIEIKSGDKPTDKSKLDKSELEFTFTGLLNRAEELAKDDATLGPLVTARIDQLRTRGLVYRQGAGLESTVLQGITFKIIDRAVIDKYSEVTFSNVVFEGEKPAIVYVVGDGDGDLDLFVFDGNSGGLIGSDEDGDSTPIVRWTPRYEGPFTLKIRNVGSIAERYVVLVNW